jgi:hypothetical protein
LGEAVHGNAPPIELRRLQASRVATWFNNSVTTTL